MTKGLTIFWIGWPILVVLCFLALVAPVIDQALFPVRVNQRIEDVYRTGNQLCWTWIGVKQYNRASDDNDATLITDEDQFVTSVFDRDTGKPFSRHGGAIKASPKPNVLHYCTVLPPFIHPSDTVRLQQVIRYAGALGNLWHVSTRVPDVVSLGER